MLPTLLWFLCGAIAVVLATVRVQLELIAWGLADGWVAAGGGFLAGGLVLALVLLVGLRCHSPRRVGFALLAVPLAVLATGYTGISTFPRQNFKSVEVRAEWKRLHPTLRLALWIARAGDRDLVLTDIARTSDDYEDMELQRREQSPHFAQVDGFAHAIDVRVTDAGVLRNWARQGFFLLVGLDALRHEGTADHLHISLPQAL